MTGVIESLERAQLRRVPSFQAGDRVKGHFSVVGDSRRRPQVFEGVFLKRQGSGVRETFTVRKQSFGVGVERTFPVHSPKIERIEVTAIGDVNRAKLYYLRGKVGKRARVRARRGVALPESELLTSAGAMPPEGEEVDEEILAEAAEGAEVEEAPVEEPAAEEPAAEDPEPEPESPVEPGEEQGEGEAGG